MAAQASELSEPVYSKLHGCWFFPFFLGLAEQTQTMCWSYGSVFLSIICMDRVHSSIRLSASQSHTPDSHFLCPPISASRKALSPPFVLHLPYTLLIVAGCASYNQSSTCRCCRWLHDGRVYVRAWRLSGFSAQTHKRRCCCCCLARIGNGCVGIPLAYFRHIPITSHHISCTLFVTNEGPVWFY